MVHRLGGIGALSSHNCKLQPLLGCMLIQDLFTTQFVPNRDATPTSWRRVNDSGRHPIPVGAVVVHRQSGDKLGQLRFRHCGSRGHRIRKRTHGARTVRARCAHGSGNTPIESKSAISLPEGLLLALAEPCFVKGVQRIDGRFFIYRSGNPAFSFDDPLISTTALPFWRSTMKFQFMQSPENLCSPAIPRPQAHNTCSASSGRRWQDTCRRRPCVLRGRRAHCALLSDQVPPEEPPGTPLPNTLNIR